MNDPFKMFLNDPFITFELFFFDKKLDKLLLAKLMFMGALNIIRSFFSSSSSFCVKINGLLMGYEWKIIKSIFIMAGSRLEDHFTNSKD